MAPVIERSQSAAAGARGWLSRQGILYWELTGWLSDSVMTAGVGLFRPLPVRPWLFRPLCH